MIVGAETTVTMVVISHEMQSKPVLVTDDGRRDIIARQPERQTNTALLKKRGEKKEKQAVETGWLLVRNQKIHTGGE